jgi:hypothetical protein
MIANLSYVSQTLCALNILAENKYLITIHDNKIHVTRWSESYEFDSEYELMVWMLGKIRDAASNAIDWFNEYKEREQNDNQAV